MRPTTRYLAGSWVALQLFAAPLWAQHVGFPWKAGDAPPAFAGFRLGQNLAKARAAMRGPIRTDSLGSGASRGYAYTTRDRGLSILGVPAEGVGIITVRRRDLGMVGGVRVGDSCESVLKRWGRPSSGDAKVAQWVAGKWLVSARCGETRRVMELSVGNVG
jgi:hypothetical protein